MKNRRIKFISLIALALLAAPSLWQDAQSLWAAVHTEAQVAWLSVFLGSPASQTEAKPAANQQAGALLASCPVPEKEAAKQGSKDSNAAAERPSSTRAEAHAESLTAAVNVPEDYQYDYELEAEPHWVGQIEKSQHKGFKPETEIAFNAQELKGALNVEKLRTLARAQRELERNERELARQFAVAASVADRLPAAYHYSVDVAMPLPGVRTDRIRVGGPAPEAPPAPAIDNELKIHLKPKRVEGTRRVPAPKVRASAVKDVSALS